MCKTYSPGSEKTALMMADERDSVFFLGLSTALVISVTKVGLLDVKDIPTRPPPGVVVTGACECATAPLEGM